jgi:hypothetical protein
MLQVEFVGAAGAFALLLGAPDVFFGDAGEPGDRCKCQGNQTAISESVLLAIVLLLFCDLPPCFHPPG